MSDVAIRVEGLSKAYRIGLAERRHETLASAMVSFVRSPLENYRNLRKLSSFGDLNTQGPGDSGADRPGTVECQIPSVPVSLGPSAGEPADVFWALRNVGFDVKHGEVVGIIGRNGAGKSTLLKILSRITEPTSGRATIYGRVGSLLEVGTGFHPDLTGRENVYLNGTILGMKKREIDAKFDEIVAFSEVERFIDTPVKRYSSGMRVRLAFAVAAHLDPEILIVDEVLAVGDAEFQRKCLGKMRDVAGQGRTVLFVSHHLGSVRALCQRGLLLQQGGLAFTGATADAVDRYLDSGDSEPTIIRQEVGKVMYVEQCQILGTGNIDYQGELHFETTVKSTVTERVSLDWRIKDELNHALSFGYPHVQYGTTQLIKKGMNRFRFRIGPLPLAEGHYRISMELDKPWSQYYDRAEDIASFRITKCIVGSAGHSLKSSWGKGSLIVPFSVEPVEDGIL